LLAVVAGACSESADSNRSPAARANLLEECRLPGVREARCGVVQVWEDRAAQSGRTIDLRVAVIPAVERFPKPDPLFILVGGPGQAATEVGPLMLSALDRIHRDRDIVLVDQRGTGSSNPLDCEPEDKSGPAEMRELFRVDFPEDRLRGCLEDYDAAPEHYTTPVAMDDLDEVRQELGYRQINLWGGSYGTRAALVYLRRHPESVRTAIIDGVAPVSMKLPIYMAPDGQRALELAFEACSASDECAARFPDLGSRFSALLAKLEAEPARVELRHPRTGETASVEIGRDAVAGILRGALYAPETAALIPPVIEDVEGGDFQSLAALAMVGGAADTISVGMFLAVVCSEDIPQISNEEAALEAKGTFFGATFYEDVNKACGLWPRSESLPEGYIEPVSSDLPVLVLSGELDPVTPPRWGERVAETLSSSLHVSVPGVGHGTWNRGCVPRMMADFIDAASVDGLDSSCVEDLHRPPFFVSFAGPPP
jgi:pimeloyl-ACP methyl ester carboxylesterase